jgi:hypothetical protein
MVGVTEEEDDSGSTLVRSGKSALTFTEIAAFVHELEARPLARLLDDLPGLMAIDETKYGLVVMVLRKKTRPDGPERAPILKRINGILAGTTDTVVHGRCQAFLKRPT